MNAKEYQKIYQNIKENENRIISYVEVKGVGINFHDFEEQIKGQLLSRGRLLYTNGNVWKYFDIEKYIEQYSENDIDYIWGKKRYEEIKSINDSLELIERELAIKKSSYAHTKKKNIGRYMKKISMN